MSRDAASILRETTLVVRPGPFRLAAWPHDRLADVGPALPPGGAGFLLVDDKEVSAFLPGDQLARLPRPTSVTDDFALLTLDATMPWDVLGVLALVTDALAQARIPAGAFAAYSRDHLMVPVAALDEARAALAPLFARITVVDG